MRRGTTGFAIGSILVAGVVVGAVLSPGYQALEPRLDGSSVWVANGSAGAIGLANTANATIERTVAVGGVDEAHQTPSGTVIVDRDASTVRVVREGAVQPGPAVPIDPGAVVAVRGDRVAVTSPTTGDVWRTTTGALAEGEPLGDTVVALGRGGVAVLGEHDLLAASPGLGRVLRVDESGDIAASDRAPVSPSSPDLQLTALGDEWVLYDAGSGVLSTSGWQTSIDATDVRLQEPGPDASAVIYATDDGLVRQQLGVHASTTLASGTSGQPAQPLVGGGCVYAAWRDGTGWRACEGEEPVVLALQGVSLDAELRIMQRGSATALVDSGTGGAWAIDRDGTRIDGWQIDDDEAAPEAPAEGETVEETVDAAPQPPVAEDDQLGARPGAVAVLPVLLNDSDANGDPLVITELALDRADASATITPDGRSIRLVAPEAGPTRVDYTVSDGVEEDSAAAVVEPRLANEPPSLVRPAQATLETGGTRVLDALDGWVDPDGDALAVIGATAEAPDRVSVRADGRLEFTDGGAGAQREVQVTVTDGQATATAAIALTVHAGAVAIAAQPVAAIARAGQELVLEPLLSAQGGSGELSLHNVVAPGLPVEPSFAEGTISVRPDAPGMLRFAYVVTDGVTTMEGRVVVRVLEGADASSAPVTMPERAALPPVGTVALDVDDLAYDPSGGVLALALATSDDTAVRAEVVDAEQLRLTLVDELDGQATVRYTVTNGVQSSAGVLRVSTSGAAAVQGPIARDDEVTVRPGGLVDIPVLANDEQPDGLALELDAEIVAPPEGGLLFADGDRMRFVAPPEPGTFTATYQVRGPDGQTATADIALRVAVAARTTNAAPAVPSVEARVVAGASVDLPLPLSDADPNGDPVQLLGPSTAPSLGFVTQQGRTTLRYQAGDYSRGTDEFRYRIADDLGAVAEGVVRVIVVEPAPALPPVLGADQASMPPDSTLVVPVLDNDSDPAGLPLEIIGVDTATPGAAAEIRDGAVHVSAGAGTADIGVVVTVENSAGTAAASWLRVDIDPAAPPPPPDVLDVQVAIQSIAEADAVRVDPLAHATVRDGRADALDASLPMVAEGVALRDDGTIEIAVADRTRFVPYTVARTDDPSARSTAVIAVPGRRDALPQLKPGVAPLSVRAGETLEIAIDDVVDTVDGGGAMLTDASDVDASPTDGSNPVIDPKTLRFVPQPGYFGPASITFEVTDGESPTDPDGRVATIVLPIEVLAGDDVPLTVLGSFVQLEPGAERTIDLARVTRAPDPARLAGATWSIAGSVPPGFQASIEGSALTVRALDETDPGIVAELPVSVRDEAGAGLPGTVVLSVISTTKPLAAPLPDAVTVQRGTSAAVSPLVNDEASNPFTTPLRIGALRDAGANERGISATVEGSDVRISAAAGAEIGATIVQVLVLDATGQPGRGVWSPITVTVQDRPDAPAPPVQVFDEHVDGVVTMAIEPPASNGSPITGYRIVGSGVDVACGPTPRCRLEGLPAGVDLRLQAIATNALGPSQPSGLSEPVHADRLPALVPGVQAVPSTAPGAVRVVWQGVPQPAGGTPIEAYLVRVTGSGLDQLVRVGAAERSAVIIGLTPGRAYSIEVAATNRAGVPDAGWRWPAAPLPFTAVGQPGTTPVLITGNDGGSVTVRWSAVDAGGAAAVRYTATVAPVNAVPACTSGGTGAPTGGTGLTATLPITDGSRSVIVVTADNGWHCSVSVSDPVFGTPMPVDASAVGIAAGADQARIRDDAVDVQLVRAPTLPEGMWFEARVAQPPQTVEPVWTRVAVGSWLTPTRTAFSYGRTATVELRVCAPSGAGAAGVCSAGTRVGDAVPLSLRAELASCRPLVPLDARPPANATPLAQGSVVASYLVGGAWTTERPATQPVPAGATQVRAWGVVTYSESAAQQHEYRDLHPTLATCGL